jgi:phospholipid transport system substrate-binding protein
MMNSVCRSFLSSLCAFATTLAVPAMLVSLPMAAQAQTLDPGQFVQALGNKAIAQLAGKGIPEDEERTRFRSLLNQYFDVAAIGKFAVGRSYWTTATQDQRKEFLSLYEAQVTNAYARRFRDYSGESFKVMGQRKEGASDTVVSSEISHPDGGPPVSVQWRVRSESGTLKITVVAIDGISMAVTDRQQFSDIIQRGGGTIQSLIDALKTKDMMPASTQG